MKQKLLFLSLLVLSCLFGIGVSAQTYPQNLLVDDFNDADLTQANWDGAIGATGWNTEYSKTEGRNGTGCIKILTGQGGFWNTALGPWPAGHKFKISCWVKGSTANSAPVIFDIQGVTNKPNFACVDQNGANGRWDTCTVHPITTDWKLQEATFVTQTRTAAAAFNITVDCNKTLYSCVGWDKPNADGYSLVDDFKIIDLGPAVPVVQGEELLADDFNDADMTLAKWDGAIGATGWNTEYSKTEGRNGTGCIKILTGQGGFWNTALGPWPAGHKFKISCWVKGSTANSAPVIFDIQGVTNKPNFACVDQNGANGRWDTCTVVPLTTDWKLQEATFVTQTRTAAAAFNITVDCNKTLYSCVGWDKPNAEGYSLVDDFKIIDLGPAVPEVQGEDLLVDDFNDADLTLAKWDGAIGATGWNTEYSKTEGRNGTGCIKILTGQGGFWNTALGPWPVDHKFKISCWVKGSTANSAPVIFDIQGVTNKPNFACVDQNGANGRWDTCTVVPLTTEWKLQEATFVTQARTAAAAFNITVDCNKTLYSCVGWDKPNAEGYSLVDDFKITDLGAVIPTGIKTMQSQPSIYISDNKLRNVNGLVSVYDIMGRLIIKSFAYEGTLNVSSLRRGIYIIHANNTAVKIVR